MLPKWVTGLPQCSGRERGKFNGGHLIFESAKGQDPSERPTKNKNSGRVKDRSIFFLLARRLGAGAPRKKKRGWSAQK